MRKQTKEEQYSIEQDSASFLYADGMVVLGHTVKNVAATAEDMTTAATWIGLAINVSKTKYMFNRKKMGAEPEEIETNWWRYGNVEMFKYVDALVTKIM